MPLQNVLAEVPDGMEGAVVPALHTNHLDTPCVTKYPPAPAATLEGAEPAKQVSIAWSALGEAALLVPVGHAVTTACLAPEPLTTPLVP